VSQIQITMSTSDRSPTEDVITFVKASLY